MAAHKNWHRAKTAVALGVIFELVTAKLMGPMVGQTMR